ncbi:MAG TPA: FAD-dependent oxidoreductase [Bacteroidales bacterium]|nr:FAD-dependent oxidoreductase [Bacteroidales bacterium]
MKNALIIGAGVSGLATAIRLAAAGWAVEVHEAAEGPGGKMGSLEQDGFRWDTGPSLFTWPALAEELFHSAGRSLSEYIPLRRLSLITRYRFADGTLVDAPSEAEAFATALERQCGEPVRNTLNYLDDCRRLFELTRPVFLEHPPGIGRIFSKDYLQAYPHLYRLRAWTSLHRHHARVFHTPQAMQLFDRYATYSGSNPYSAPATLRVIAHLEHNEGAYFPEQGMYGFARGLYRLGQELGVSYHFNSRALRLVERSGRIAGVETTRGYREAGVVVSSADVSGPEGFSRKDPLPPERLSSSAIIFFLGLNKSYPGLDLHNMFFSADYQNEFRQMFSELNLAPDMSIYVFVSSKLVPPMPPPAMRTGSSW